MAQDEDGSGSEGPHFEAEFSGSEGPHLKAALARSGSEGPHLVEGADDSGSEGPHLNEKTMAAAAGGEDSESGPEPS